MAKAPRKQASVAGRLPSITDSFVERVAKPKGRNAVFYYDRRRTGFGVKVYPLNDNTNKPSKRVYGVRVTVEGNKKRWITIGPHGDTWKAKSAREEARQIRENIQYGRPLFAHRSDKKASLYRMDDLGKAFLLAFKLSVEQGLRSEESLRRYQNQWDELVPKSLKETSVSELKPSLFKAALKTVSEPEGQKKRPILGNRVLAMLSATLGWVMEQDPDERMGLSANHCSGVKRNGESKTRGVWMEDRDQAKLLAFLQDPNNRLEVWWEAERQAREDAKRRRQLRAKQKPPHHLVRTHISQALHLLFISGLRSWEVMALRWDDIHQRSRSISVEQTKKGANPSSTVETKRLYISEEVQAVLDQIPETSEWVFPSSGRSVKPKSGHLENMQDSWERIRTYLGIEAKIRLHDYRHTAASEMGDSDSVSVKDLMEIFGWKTEQTAMRYLHSRARARDQRVQDITTQRMTRLSEVKATDTEAQPREVPQRPHRAKVPSLKDVKAMAKFAADQLPAHGKIADTRKGRNRTQPAEPENAKKSTAGS